MPRVRVTTNDENCCGASMPFGAFVFEPGKTVELVMTPEEYSSLKGFAESDLGNAFKSVEKLAEPEAAPAAKTKPKQQAEE